MKKILVLCICLFCILSKNVYVFANEQENVTFARCVDGDTAHFLVKGKDETIRFLAIDTPEYTKTKEAYGKEASEYTCKRLKEAKTITLEYDDGSSKTDKYGRLLAWVYVDGQLLQEELVKEGLAEISYLYGDYAHTDQLNKAQKQAQKQKLNIWSETQEKEVDSIIVTIVSGVIIVFILLSGSKRKKTKIRKVKKIAKKINSRR